MYVNSRSVYFIVATSFASSYGSPSCSQVWRYKGQVPHIPQCHMIHWGYWEHWTWNLPIIGKAADSGNFGPAVLVFCYLSNPIMCFCLTCSNYSLFIFSPSPHLHSEGSSKSFDHSPKAIVAWRILQNISSLVLFFLLIRGRCSLAPQNHHATSYW